MKKQVIKLTESDLHRIIKESVKKIIREVAVGGPNKGWRDSIDGDFPVKQPEWTKDPKWDGWNGEDPAWLIKQREMRGKNPWGESRGYSKGMLKETDCAGVMQTGCGDAPKGTNPEAGQYPTAFGPDKDTADRTPGKVAMGGRAKWNVNNGNVQRREIYNPKSGKKR